MADEYLHPPPSPPPSSMRHHRATSEASEIVEVQGGHIVRSTGRKDRHSKVFTAKGPRDRRVRLSAHTGIQFYDVQDRLGFDRPSKAVDWLIKKAKTSIDELPPWNPDSADALRQAAANAKPRRTTAKTQISPPPPPQQPQQQLQFGVGFDGGGGRAEHSSNNENESSFLPPSMDSDSIADTIKSFFPVVGSSTEAPPNHQLMHSYHHHHHPARDQKSSDLPFLTAQPSLPVEKAACTATKPPLLKLHFINSPPPLIFTGSKIEADDGSPIAIELVDAATNTRVTLDSRFDIVLLHGDFPGESWTTEDFNRNIIRSREGKRPLLVGDLTVTLKDGVGVIGGDVAFTDNASRKFRLGAKATQGGVVEAISEAFVCKDHRGVSAYRKHHPPYPDSEVRRLENIPQGGVTDTCFPGSQSVFLDRAFSDTSDVFGPLRTCATSSPFEDYDVVIRYGRGDVSNDDFISHLRAALYRRGISVNSEFDEGDAVPECRVLIILLTSTYAPSNLSNILEHQHTENRVVYPIFYRLSPYDFVCNSKNYESFFLQEEPKRWQDALKEISQMPGYTLTDKSESELIDEIVRDTLKVLCSGDKVNMIGMDMQVKEILSLLCIESLDVRSIGIWGSVGIGKTAIAEEIFRRICVQYETCVFLKDLHKKVEVKGHDAVREDFLSKVLEVEPHVIRISDIRTSFLRSRLQRKKVLVILDDVNDYRDVETFLGKLNYFGPGSRIIMTSRNKRVFVLCKIEHVYEVKPLDIPNSLLLLDRETFQIALSPEVYRTLLLELVKFSSGNPQVLLFLSNSDREWNRLSQEVQKTSPIYIPDIFERSCCGLDDNERSIFLDIACFFNRMDKDNVAMLLDGCGFSANVGFRGLVEKSLLTISHHNLVDMLSFIQATGREIVRQESADRPGDRSRLWNAEDIRDVLINDTGTSAIKGIFLDMLSLKFDANANVFEKMRNLRLLKLYFSKVEEKHGVSFTQGLEYLPSKLRLLHWEYYPLSSLPRSFNPENLVGLNLPNSCAKKLWKGKKSLEKLKKMRLSYSYQLTKIPRLSSAPNLELLDLEGCNSLLSISQSITYLKKLVFLNLKDCSKLESIPSMVDLESLEVLNLSGCSKLENFPEISPNVKELYIGGTMIQEIPSSIKNLVLLEKLDLENSRHLKNLPTSICKLKHLETLNLSGCVSLDRFPDLSRRIKCLRFLDLSRTAIKELPSSISYLTALEELRYVDSRNVVRLPDKPIDLQGSSQDFLTHFAPKSERVKPIYLQGLSSDFRTHVAPKSETSKQPSHSSTSSENGCDEEEAMEEEVETEGTGALFTQLGDMAGEACSITTNKSDSLKIVSNISPIYASGGSIIKSWQKGQLLGRGSFGSVYEGISVDGDFFAVKEVSLLEDSLLDQGSPAQECIQQLEGEIALLRQLQHPNIVRYRGTAKDELNLYIFLELVTQGSLLKLYQRYQLTDSLVSLYTRQILDGLKYLHDRGFIHRNIKCANVLVDASGAIKLADFGLTKVCDMKFQRRIPFWMAPEVINPKHNNGYGSPADIWSLGCTVLEMLTGQIPYFNLEPVAALFRIGTGKLPEIPDTLSVDARHFILRCLQVNPEERPTVNELLNHPFVRRPLPSSGSGSDSGKATKKGKAKAEPTREEMLEVVSKILKEVDLNKATLSDILQKLSDHFGVDLSHRKPEVKDVIKGAINAMTDE